MAELSEQNIYKQKLADLQKYVPFLEKMINHLKNTNEKSREVQLTKMESLYSMITDSNRKLKYDILLKCEEVIAKLQERMYSNPALCPTNEIVSKEESTKKIVNTSKKDQQQHQNTKNSETVLTTKRNIESTFKPTSSKKQECKSEQEKESEIKGREQKGGEEEDSDSEKMDDYHRNRIDEFHDRRYARNGATYGRKYRPFSTASAKQKIILPLLMDVMKTNSSNDCTEMSLEQSRSHDEDNYNRYLSNASPLDNQGRNYRDNYNNYYDNARLDGSNTYSSPPLDDLRGNSRDNYNNYYDNMRMDPSNRYSSSSPVDDFRGNSRDNYNNYDNIRVDSSNRYPSPPVVDLRENCRDNYNNYENIRVDSSNRYPSPPVEDLRENCRDNYNNYYENTGMGSSSRHSPNFLVGERNDYDRINERDQVWYGNMEYPNERHESYNYDKDCLQSRRLSPTIGGFRKPDGNVDRNMRYERDGFAFKRNHYQPGRRNFRKKSRFSSYRNENNSRSGFYRRDVIDHSDNEDSERFKFTRPEINNKGETFEKDDMLKENNEEDDTKTRHGEHFLKNDPRGYSKNYKKLTDKFSKPQDYTDKNVSNVQNIIEDSSDTQTLKLWKNKSVIDENTSNLKDIGKSKEIDKHNLRNEELHNVIDNFNRNDRFKIQFAKQDDKNEDASLKIIEDTPSSKYDKMYTNLANKSLFVSPLETLYSDKTAPKNFKIPKKQNPTKIMDKIENDKTDYDKTVEKEIPIQRSSKTSSKNNSTKKSKTRKKILIINDNSDDENTKEISLKQLDQNIVLPNKEKIKSNRSNADAPKPTQSDNVNSEDESEVETLPTKRRKLNPLEDDKPKKLNIGDEKSSIEKPKEEDNLCIPNDDVKTQLREDEKDESTQQLSNINLKSNQDTVKESVKSDCSIKDDDANVESLTKIKETCISQGVNEVTSTSTIQQAKQDIIQEASKSNSMDVLEFIIKNYKQIRKIFKEDSSSDEEHSSKKGKKKKKKRKKYSSSSSSSSESEDEKRKTKKESTRAVAEKKFEESDSVQTNNKIDTSTEEVPKNDTDLEQKKKKSKLDTSQETLIDIPSAKEEFKKKINTEPKHRKSELDILHESIKEMWMGDDIVRATGKRACTVSKEPTDTRSVQIKKLESIEKFIENASKLRVLVTRQDFTKLLKKNVPKKETLRVIRAIESREKTKSKRKSVSEGDNNIKSYFENSTMSHTPPITNPAKSLVSTTDIASTSIRDSKSAVTANTKESLVAKEDPPKLPVSENIAVPIQGSIKLPAAANISVTPATKQESFTIPTSASTRVTPMSKQENPKLVTKRPVENVRLLPSHHDKNYFIHGDKTSCRLCNFNGKLITPHYITRHKSYEVLTSRINPLITDILIDESKLNNYASITLSEGPRCKYSYKCPFCETIFASEYVFNFYDHLTSHTGEHRYQCDKCDYSWHSIRFFQKHYTKHNAKNLPIPKEPPPYSDIVFGYVCLECYYVQTLEENIKAHNERYHENKAEIMKVNLNLVALEFGNVDVDVIDNDCNITYDDESDFNVNSFLELKLENATNVNIENSEQDDASVKIEDNEIQGVNNREADNSCDSSSERSSNTPNLDAFVCEANIVDQKVEKKRLDKMNEILGNVNIQRASVADKLQTKLVSNESEFVEVEYQYPSKSKEKGMLPQSPDLVLENNHNVQAQKAKPSRTFIAESQQGINTQIVTSGKNLVEPKIPNRKSALELNSESILKPVKFNVLTTTNTTTNPELQQTLRPQVTVGNKKFTSISNIINRLQDNLQPNLQKKSSKGMGNGDELSIDSNSSERNDIDSHENDNTPPPLIHYTELITEDKKSLPVQLSTKTYKRSPKGSGSSSSVASLNLDAGKKSDEDLPPPSLSHYKSLTMNKTPGLVLIAGPLKLMLGKKGNMIYSCSDCKFDTEDINDFEKHCDIAHINHIYENWSCSKCDKVFTRTATSSRVFMHIKSMHLDSATSEIVEPIAQDDVDSVKDSGVGSTINPDSSSSSSLILQNNTVDSKYRFVITSVKSLANDSEPSSSTESVCSDILRNKPPDSITNNNDKPPVLIKVSSQASKNPSTSKPEYIRPVPISKLLDTNAEDGLGISSSSKVYEPIIEPKTPLAIRCLLSSGKMAHFYKCPLSNCVFSCFGGAEFNQHLLLHRDATVFCLYCNKVEQLSTYMAHLETSHYDCRYACSLCFYRATSPTLVKTHIGIAHSQVKKVMIVGTPATTMPRRPIRPYEYPPINNLIKPYVCGEPDCKMETIFSSVFLEHYFTVHYLKKKMSCGLCDHKLFKGILQHYWTMHDIYPYHCRYCPSGANKLHLVVEHQALQHNNLHLCLLSRSPKKNKKDSPKTTDEYSDIQILFERTINLNKLNINTTEMTPDDALENNTLSLNATAGTASNSDNLHIDNATETFENEVCVSTDSETLTTHQIQCETDLSQNIISLDDNEEVTDGVDGVDFGDDLHSLNFPNTTFSTSIEESLKTFVVKKPTDIQPASSKTLAVPKTTTQNPLKKRFTCVVCSVQFVHKLSAMAHMKKLHGNSNSTNRSSVDSEVFMEPKCSEKDIMGYFRLLDGTLYPSCNICGLQVTRRRCTHVQSRPDRASVIDGKISTTCFVFPNLKTVLLRKMVVDALIIPSFIPTNLRYRCQQTTCKRLFRSASSFSRHLLSKHSKDKHYPCGHCGVVIETHLKLLNIYAIHKHFEMHGPILYRCYHCHYFDTVVYTMELHMSVIHPSRSPTDYEVVRLDRSKPQTNDKRSTKTHKKIKSSNSSNPESNSLLRKSLLTTSTNTVSSSDDGKSEVDLPEIILSDSDDGENCQNVIQQDTLDLFATPNDTISFDISLNDDDNNTQNLIDICIDLESDAYVTDVSDRLEKLIDSENNEDVPEINYESDTESFKLAISTPRTYSKNKKHNLFIPSESTTSMDTKCNRKTNSSDMETIVIDDIDEDCDTQNQVADDNSMERNVQIQESEVTNEHIEKKVFIKPKAFSSKSLIEEDITSEVILPPNFNIQELSNKLQKAIGHDPEDVENESSDLSIIDGEIKNITSEVILPPNFNIQELSKKLQKAIGHDPEDVENESNDLSIIDGEIKNSEQDETSFVFGRPFGPFVITSLNCYQCPVCMYKGTYSKEFHHHLSVGCDELGHLAAKENSPIKNRLDWARTILVCQTKIMNFWKDTFRSEESLCRFCPMLVTRSTLRRHEITHFMTKPFNCNYCNFSCLKEDAISRHMTIRHEHMMNTYDMKKPSNFPINPPPNMMLNELFLMELFDISDFEDMDEPISSYLRTRMSSLSDFVGNCTPPDESPNKQQYLCKMCNKAYPDRNLRKLHTKAHYKVYKCKYCAFSAPNFRIIRKHHFDNHSTEVFEFLYDFIIESNLDKFLKNL